MAYKVTEVWLWRVIVGLCVVLVLVPNIDMAVSSLFFQKAGASATGTFIWAALPAAQMVHEAAAKGAFVVAGLLGGAFLYCAIRLRRLAGVGARAWLFLLVALVVGPGLIVNGVFKEYWGRARPIQIEEFGGSRHFSPPLVVANQCRHNCSFASGDAAAGFFLHSFCYVAGRRRRTLFVGGLAVGFGVGMLRVAMGAHFLSDVLFAGLFVVASSAALHALFYGRAATVAWWRANVFAGWCVAHPPREEGLHAER